jgi:glycolate oxidase iron-sulfur subunit
MDAFDALEVEAVIVNSAGCGSGMKDYGLLFEGDPRDAERARAFSARVFDVTEYLASLEPRAPRHPLPLRAAYHDPCHLQHAQGLRDAPRSLLRGIPGLELMEVAESAICCGSAGIYNLVEPTAARDLGDRKATNLLATMADVVIASNPGCALQIAAATRRAGRVLNVVHAVELLDASIRGISLPVGGAKGVAVSTSR